MNRLPTKNFRHLTITLLTGIALGVVSAGANAATYNIIFKDAGGTPYTCITGGFTATNTGVAGPVTTTAPSVTINTAVAPCNTIAGGTPTTLSTGTVSGEIVNSGSAQDNYKTLWSAAGALDNGSNGNNKYTLTMSSSSTYGTNGTYTLTKGVGGGTVTLCSNCQFYVYNQASLVSEPETLVLLMAAGGAMAFHLRRRRRR